MTLTHAQRLVNSRSEKTAKLDFYPTPRDATEALLREVRLYDDVHEGACGNGAMVTVLREHGVTVSEASDIVDYGFPGTVVQDFLKLDVRRGHCFVTNPPFNKATEFAERAILLGYDQICLLSRTQFLNGKRRGELFSAHPPTTIYVFTWRLNFRRADYTGPDAPMGDHCWIHWDLRISNPVQTSVRWLKKPT